MSEASGVRLGASALRWWLLSALVIALDLGSKAWLSASLPYGRPVEVIPGFFNLLLLHNTGAAFSFLAEHAGWQRWLFAVIAVVAVAALSVWLTRTTLHERFTRAAIALIIGGAIGNLFDRVVHGYVIDFLSFHWQQLYYYPAFNIADTAITLGAIGLIVTSLFSGRRSKAGEAHE
ncbi:signal peptidase II [Kushneria phosphatilytica]|uniref:Lipoprotein signal peptidase n=1 Tax=Kushneria phosphatilytica TaxID=657387 RepID=A0A1S1NWC2_9GAMM|nr:signal peptidase II [Kushneria phosphatilytica]OHV11495.1 signal peptidase II [Kushneria phosphatilytica]QEL12092.1 lipoprotein signal peptidase [Kushneria phosphatilytica]